ncbi:hypothetical protein QQ045_018149 [Rhodiola kirilowii]
MAQSASVPEAMGAVDGRYPLMGATLKMRVGRSVSCQIRSGLGCAGLVASSLLVGVCLQRSVVGGLRREPRLPVVGLFVEAGPGCAEGRFLPDFCV